MMHNHETCTLLGRLAIQVWNIRAHLKPIGTYADYSRSGDDTLFREFEEVVIGCVHWIDHYGDRNGDGFQEYQTRSTQGYENMSWRDSGDAVMYPDGSPVKRPKALCELQGYVFDAKRRLAEAAEYLGDITRAGQLRQEAATLQARFEEQFWCEDLGYYAYALDGDKQPVKTIASNAGHLLWSGIVRPERAELFDD